MAELKRKVTIRRKQSIAKTKKTKWWLWLLLAIVVIVGVVLIVKSYSSYRIDKNVKDKTEQAIEKASEVIFEIQRGNINFEEEEAKVALAQKEVDEAKANAKTMEEKQAVSEAQVKVDDATKLIEVKKQVTKEKSEANTSQGDRAPIDKPNTNVSSTPSAILPERTLEEKAILVIRGDFGNGMDRKNALGSEYDAIQSKVNEMYRNGEVR